MIFNIVQQTPVWVWVLLAKLVALGLWQTRQREMSLLRVTVLPVVLLVLSMAGVFNTFGTLPASFGAWLCGLTGALLLPRRLHTPAGARWSAARASLHVPGSWLPLALILGSFSIKYFAGASLSMHPALASDATFAALCSAGFGCFNGLFMGRAMALRALARDVTTSESMPVDRTGRTLSA